jgi:hypothetical protein
MVTQFSFDPDGSRLQIRSLQLGPFVLTMEQNECCKSTAAVSHNTLIPTFIWLMSASRKIPVRVTAQWPDISNPPFNASNSSWGKKRQANQR